MSRRDQKTGRAEKLKSGYDRQLVVVIITQTTTALHSRTEGFFSFVYVFFFSQSGEIQRQARAREITSKVLFR